jgi:hypothetical protein
LITYTQGQSTTVEMSCKEMLQYFDSKKSKLKRGDTHAGVRGVLTAMIWKDKRDKCILTNVHKPAAEGKLL